MDMNEKRFIRLLCVMLTSVMIVCVITLVTVKFISNDSIQRVKQYVGYFSDEIIEKLEKGDISNIDDVKSYVLSVRNNLENNTLSDEIVILFNKRLIYWIFPFTSSITILGVLLISNVKRRYQLRYSHDITRESLKLYLGAVANTSTVLVEYNVKNKEAVFSNIMVDRYRIPEIMLDIPKSLINMKIIHADDVKMVCAMFKEIDSGLPKSKHTIRIYDDDRNIHWLNVVMTNSFDKMGNPNRAIAVIRDITDDKNSEMMMIHKSERDQATGLYNKVTGIGHIKMALKTGCKKDFHALYVIDIDNFKSVNDRLGHDTGDIVIGDVAKELNNIFRESDIVCRFGGDEFVVFVKNIESTESIAQKADELCCSLRKKYGAGEKSVHISGSIGIAYFPTHGTTYEELFKNADAALYQTKENGKNSYAIFSDVSDESQL